MFFTKKYYCYLLDENYHIVKLFSPRNSEHMISATFNNGKGLPKTSFRATPVLRLLVEHKLEIGFDLESFESKNPVLFAKLYSPNFENPERVPRNGFKSDLECPH